MSEDIRHIAERIRGLREIYDLSVENLSKELDVPLEDCIKFESGNSDIPISYLTMLAAHFKIEVTALLTGKDPKLHIYDLTRSGKGILVERSPEYVYQSLAYNFGSRKCEPFLVTVEPCDKPVSLNTHDGQEYEYVLEGEITCYIGSKEFNMKQGDSIYIDPRYPHGFLAQGKKPAKVLAIVL